MASYLIESLLENGFTTFTRNSRMVDDDDDDTIEEDPAETLAKIQINFGTSPCHTNNPDSSPLKPRPILKLKLKSPTRKPTTQQEEKVIESDTADLPSLLSPPPTRTLIFGNHTVLVDEQFARQVGAKHWWLCVNKRGGNENSARLQARLGSKQLTDMNRFIWSLSGRTIKPGQMLIYKNYDHLDNRLSNIDCVSMKERVFMTAIKRQKQDPTYTRGIHYAKSTKKWTCTMVIEDRRFQWSFKTKEEAAKKWNQLMLKRRDIRDEYKFYNPTI